MYTYIYIYIYVYTGIEREILIVSTGHDVVPLRMEPCDGALGRGQMGSALMGSVHFLCFLTEGPFGYSC